LDEYGNTVARPGPLIPDYPLEPLVQGFKYRASEYGLRYSLQQTINFVSLTDVMQGQNSLAFYTLTFKGKWAIYSSAGGDNAGWLSTQIGVKTARLRTPGAIWAPSLIPPTSLAGVLRSDGSAVSASAVSRYQPVPPSKSALASSCKGRWRTLDWCPA